VTAKFLNDGQFMHPAAGITLYIREITSNGELRDMFLADNRAKTNRVTYTAARALLVRGDTGPKLIMFDGMAQTVTKDAARLSVTRFADFTYDLGALISVGDNTGRTVEELSTADLLRADPAVITETGESRAAFLYEAHSRFATPFLATAASLIGFASLLLGGFSRFGLWRQIIFAVVMLIAVQTLNTLAASAGLRSDARWWLAYVAPIFGLALGVFLLWYSQRPRHVPTAVAA
jgi:lipopolysaccharide export system permease protein